MIQRCRPLFFFLLSLTVMMGAITVTPGTAMARKAVLEDMFLTTSRDHLMLYFNVHNAFTPRIMTAVENGIPTTFTFHLSLYQPRNNWWDRKITNRKITTTLKYNTLKQEFSLTRPWKSDAALTLKNARAAQEKMTQVNGFKLIPLSRLVPGKTYQVRVKAEMKKIKLPLYLHHLFFFLSFWDFETKWHTMNFIYQRS